MKIHQKREIKKLNKEIKNLKSYYSKKIRESKNLKKSEFKKLQLGSDMSIVQGPESEGKEMREKINIIKQRIA